MIRRINIIFLVVVFLLGCKTDKTKVLTTLNSQSNCEMEVVMDNVIIYLPTEHVIQFSDSLCNEEIITDYCFFSDFFSFKKDTLITLFEDATKNELYSFLKERHRDSLLFETYKDFDYLFFSYCRLIIGECLSTGSVKLFNKLTNEYVTQYQVNREKDENGGITDYYYLPDNTLFYEDVISIGL